MTSCVAAIVVWAAVSSWGIAEGNTCEECQVTADAMAEAHNTNKQTCVPVGKYESLKPEQYKAIREYIVRWDIKPEGRIVYACNQRRCSEIE